MPARVFHAHCWGLRQDKYDWLMEHDVSTTPWSELKPDSPFYLFVPQDIDLKAEYDKGWKITEAMPVNVLGFQTHRDHFAIDFDQKEIHRRVSAMRNGSISDQALRERYGLRDNRDWNLAIAREQVRNQHDWRTSVIECLYRPFDRRWCYFATSTMDYPRCELLHHVAQKHNLCILSSRQQATFGYRHCWVAEEPANDCVVSTTSREANQVFPLYTYPTARQQETFFDNSHPTSRQDGRQPNLDAEFVDQLQQRIGLRFLFDGKGNLKKTFGPEDILAYMYAIFHSPTYRQRYAELLKIDFPRLPLTANVQLFRQLCRLGEELIDLHLMKKHGPNMVSYPIRGNNIVEKVKYTQPDEEDKIPGRVWINKRQHFENVPPEVWEFHIGGYQVCAKWLKDRKGRQLSYEDLTHYRHIVSALSETMRLMEEIDAVIDEHGSWPLK